MKRFVSFKMEPYVVPELNPYLVIYHDAWECLDIKRLMHSDICDNKRSMQPSGDGRYSLTWRPPEMFNGFVNMILCVYQVKTNSLRTCIQISQSIASHI